MPLLNPLALGLETVSHCYFVNCVFPSYQSVDEFVGILPHQAATQFWGLFTEVLRIHINKHSLGLPVRLRVSFGTQALSQDLPPHFLLELDEFKAFLQPLISHILTLAVTQTFHHPRLVCEIRLSLIKTGPQPVSEEAPLLPQPSLKRNASPSANKGSGSKNSRYF